MSTPKGDRKSVSTFSVENDLLSVIYKVKNQYKYSKSDIVNLALESFLKKRNVPCLLEKKYKRVNKNILKIKKLQLELTKLQKEYVMYSKNARFTEALMQKIKNRIRHFELKNA